MSPRRRSKAKRGWPDNLYERKGYFSWRDPRTREEFGLGRDRGRAFQEAMEANIHLAKLTASKRLVHRIEQANTPLRGLAAWNVKYQEQLKANERSPNSLRSAKSLGARMVRMLGDVPMDSLTPLAISKVIDDVVAEGKIRLAQALRGFMRDCFREARVAGWLTKENPVLDTRLGVRVKVMRSRLSLDQFRLIYARIDDVWLRNAVDLALVSGQRRDDVANAMFKDFRDGHWWLIQRKTGNRVALPMSLTLDAIGKSLESVVAQCRRTGVLSGHLVHQTARRGNSPVGRHIWVDTISRRFADAVEAAGIDWGNKTPATFHELRSLSARLYAAQGGVNTRDLLGHRTAEMTEEYEDDRGAGWVHVSFSR
jgi:enterobacteria phage integrase